MHMRFHLRLPSLLLPAIAALPAAADGPAAYWEGVPYAESPYIYGIHDPGGEPLMEEAGAPGWVCHAIEVGHDPNGRGGFDFTDWANRGFGVICRLQHDWAQGGAISYEKHYDDFAKRCANFVADSRGCRIWLIGNETNLTNEHPKYEGHAEPVSPEMYARCYLKVREAIKKLPGHETDEVIVEAISCWAPPLWPGAPPSFLAYFDRICAAIGRNTDGFSIHAYTHGPDPAGVLSKEKRAGMYWNFKTYIDVMEHIPVPLRKTSVYITESASCDPHKWTDENSGFVKNTYLEIDTWNKNPPTGQKVKCVCLYRWQPNDQHNWGGRKNVEQDFREASQRKYTWTGKPAKKYIPPPPPPPPVAAADAPAAAKPAKSAAPAAPPAPSRAEGQPGDETRRLMKMGENSLRSGLFARAGDCFRKVIELKAEGDAEALDKAQALLKEVDEKLK